MLETIVFLVLALIITGGGIYILFSKEPVYSVFSLVVSLLAMAGIFALIGAPFLAALQIIIYAGAGVVMIVMAVMFYKNEKNSLLELKKWWFGAILLFVFLLNLLAIELSFGKMGLSAGQTSTKELSLEFFKNYIYPFELISVLILVGVVGVLILAKKREGE